MENFEEINGFIKGLEFGGSNTGKNINNKYNINIGDNNMSENFGLNIGVRQGDINFKNTRKNKNISINKIF